VQTDFDPQVDVSGVERLSVLILSHIKAHSVPVLRFIIHMILSRRAVNILHVAMMGLIDASYYPQHHPLPLDVVHFLYHHMPINQVAAGLAIFGVAMRYEMDILEAMIQCGIEPTFRFCLQGETDVSIPRLVKTNPCAVKRMMEWNKRQARSPVCRCGWKADISLIQLDWEGLHNPRRESTTNVVSFDEIMDTQYVQTLFTIARMGKDSGTLLPWTETPLSRRGGESMPEVTLTSLCEIISDLRAHPYWLWAHGMEGRRRNVTGFIRELSNQGSHYRPNSINLPAHFGYYRQNAPYADFTSDDLALICAHEDPGIVQIRPQYLELQTSGKDWIPVQDDGPLANDNSYVPLTVGGLKQAIQAIQTLLELAKDSAPCR